MLTGPVMLITVGVLFLVGEYTRYSFGYLWPILLIVAGLMMFAQAMAPMTGHIERRRGPDSGARSGDR
jgi:Domain of unknown function (DUF5668)